VQQTCFVTTSVYENRQVEVLDDEFRYECLQGPWLDCWNCTFFLSERL